MKEKTTERQEILEEQAYQMPCSVCESRKLQLIMIRESSKVVFELLCLNCGTHQYIIMQKPQDQDDSQEKIKPSPTYTG